MGHYCRYCGRMRPNEKFSGKRHRVHICKECQRIPRAERGAMKGRITGLIGVCCLAFPVPAV